MTTQKTISEQLRAYNRLKPPCEETILRARNNWDTSYKSKARMAVKIKQHDIENYLSRRVHNDNRHKAFA